jgi:hypothetical protein
MGDIADLYADYYDEDRDDEDVTCEYCGTGGLEWAFTGKRWVLMNEAGEVHVCDVAYEFEDVS